MDLFTRKIKLRNYPETLSEDDVRSLVKKYDFFDFNRNRNGKGIKNRYRLIKFKSIEEFNIENLCWRGRNAVVIDKTTNLMWQYGGCTTYLSYDQINPWLIKLNQEGYASYHDWRLPTLEEALSLMNPIRNQDGMYTDSIFRVPPDWIWTSDLVSSEMVRQISYMQGRNISWSVDFGDGACDWHPLRHANNCIRAVRSARKK